LDHIVHRGNPAAAKENTPVHLKSLEIQGFKSFPEKTTLVFNDTITAIVGPNGSGKSNISDALRWVMGEQSNKALRGTKMEDVIFGGSVGRAPSGFAQVTMVLGNEQGELPVDSPEVAVTRRVYRSGESEFYINRRSVRLRDIHELFMDTGLGRDGYSIIGQGRIDEILSARSTDRREVFEEAAGISRFRSRKQEAERKLEGAAANLLRVNDKLAELELQIGPLKEQAEVAKRYLVIRDELRGIESALWLEELRKAAELSKKHRENALIAQQQSERARAEQRELYARTEELEGMYRALESKGEELRDELSSLELAAASLMNEAEAAQNAVRSNEENISRITAELRSREERGTKIREQLEEKRTRIDSIDEELGALRLRVTELRDRIRENSDLEAGAAAELTRLLEEMLALRGEKANLSARYEALSEQESRAEERRTALEQEIGMLEHKYEAALSEEEEARSELEKARSASEYRANVARGCALKRSSREEEYNNSLKLAAREKEKLTAIESRWNILSEMERDYDGYNRAVKRIMQEKQRGSLRNIHGPVSHLLSAEDRYVVAIETALGISAQSIVVSSEADAKAAIMLLKRADAGRATFLPLSSVRGSTLKESGLPNESGFVGLAASLISYDPKYEQVFASLLGRTAVTGDLDAAINIGRKYGHRFKIVTLDGQIISSGGAMTGGSVSRSTGILSRAAELARLNLEKQESQKQLEALEKKAARAYSDFQKARAEHESALAEQRELEDKVLLLSGLFNQKSSEKRSVLEALERARSDMDGEAAQRRARAEERDALEEKIRSVSARLEKLEADRAEAAEGSQDLRLSGEELRRELERIDAASVALAAEKNAEQSLTAEFSRMAGEISDYRAGCMARIREIESDTARLLDVSNRKKEEAAAVAVRIEELKRKLAETAGLRADIDEQKQAVKAGIQDKNTEIIALEREAARLESRCAETELAEKQLVDKLWDTYGLTRETAAGAAAPIDSQTKARQRAAELRKEMASLGTVNLGAIDEFERVSSRWEYLTGQRDDALKSKKELEGIIRSMTGEMKELFTARFAEINEKFQETFSEIFGGGTAGICLEDDENVLECGIEIKIQPPGKKVRSISLLSGGEKAFAAIALYFAIMKIRPAPFCVLDEIETALDEVNVVRFAKYLKHISKTTQVVAITHRRPTMELAGILYGVTMYSKGISKVLTLALDQVERELLA